MHCVTRKGYGYEPAQGDPVKYHGVSSFEVSSGTMAKGSSGPPSWTQVFSDALIQLAREDERRDAASGHVIARTVRSPSPDLRHPGVPIHRRTARCG